MTLSAAVRSLRAAVAAAPLLLTAAPALAGLPTEAAAVAAGQALVETASAGRVDEAFKTAAGLSSPSDPVVGRLLSARQPAVSAEIQRLGGLAGKVRLADVEPSIFSGCLRREYRVRYAGGEQRWLVKFRRTARGWALADLEVIGRIDVSVKPDVAVVPPPTPGA